MHFEFLRAIPALAAIRDLDVGFDGGHKSFSAM